MRTTWSLVTADRTLIDAHTHPQQEARQAPAAVSRGRRFGEQESKGVRSISWSSLHPAAPFDRPPSSAQRQRRRTDRVPEGGQAPDCPRAEGQPRTAASQVSASLSVSLSRCLATAVHSLVVVPSLRVCLARGEGRRKPKIRRLHDPAPPATPHPTPRSTALRPRHLGGKVVLLGLDDEAREVACDPTSMPLGEAWSNVLCAGRGKSGVSQSGLVSSRLEARRVARTQGTASS